MSIHRHLPGRRANTQPKLCVKSIPWRQAIRLIKQHTWVAFWLCVCVQTKAVSVLLRVKGNQLRAVKLKHNSVCVLIWLVSAFLPAVTQHWYLRGGFEAPVPVREARLSLHPAEPPLNFSALWRGVSICVWACEGGGELGSWHYTSCFLSDWIICPIFWHFNNFLLPITLDRATWMMNFFLLISFMWIFPTVSMLFFTLSTFWSHLIVAKNSYWCYFQHKPALICTPHRLKCVFIQRV